MFEFDVATDACVLTIGVVAAVVIPWGWARFEMRRGALASTRIAHHMALTLLGYTAFLWGMTLYMFSMPPSEVLRGRQLLTPMLIFGFVGMFANPYSHYLYRKYEASNPN